MRQLFCLLVIAAAIVASSGSKTIAAPSPLSYPPTPRENVIDHYYGTAVRDPYRWLESLNSAETKRWIAQENAVTTGYLASLPRAPHVDQGYGGESSSEPEHHGRYWVRWINRGNPRDGILHVSTSPDVVGSILFDPKAELHDKNETLGNYVRYVFSSDGRYMAYSTISGGSEWETWHIRDVASKRDLPERLTQCAYAGPAWAGDSTAFYYVHYPPGSDSAPASSRFTHARLYLHKLNTRQSEDRVVFSVDAHPDWFIGGSTTNDGRYMVIGAGGNGGFALWVADLRRGFEMKPLGLKSAYFIGNDGPRLYFITVDGAPRHRIVSVDMSNSGRISTIVAEQPDVIQENTLLGNQGEEAGPGRTVTLVGNRLYVVYLHDAHTLIRIFDLKGHPVGSIPLPGIGTADAPKSGYRWDRYIYYTYTSIATPYEIFRYDTVTGASTVTSKPASQIPTDIVTDLVFATSKDGTRIPMFLTHRRGLRLDGNAPTMMWGYGGPDWDNTPRFNPTALDWSAMGGIYATTIVRGGTEYGSSWHTAAEGLTKQRTFDDFIACAEKLIKEKYTSAPRLAIYGASMGGLLVGAVVTQRPDLFGAAVSDAGLYDMVRGNRMGSSGWDTDDFGSADASEAQFRALFAYSPYHHVRDGTRYPAMLIVVGLNDDRVFPGHSLKFAAALQHAQAGDAPILLYTSPNAGHYAEAPPGTVSAFLLKALGVTGQTSVR